jgi:LPPG:FO 2-phospho-L-lactate transferase
MADAPRPTMIETPGGTLSFQDWLVGQRGVPAVTAVRFGGPPRPATDVIDAIVAADVVVIPPSNPYVSIDPILALDGVRAAIASRPVVAVSPIVGGKAVKGPLAGMISTLAGRAASAAAIADHYADLLDAFVIERGDDVGSDLQILATATVMGDRSDRARLASEVLALARRIT